MLSEEAANTNFIVFGLTRSMLKSTIYHTRGEHADHYTTDAVGYVVGSSKEIKYVVFDGVLINRPFAQKIMEKYI
jgi:hypothetical protein